MYYKVVTVFTYIQAHCIDYFSMRMNKPHEISVLSLTVLYAFKNKK